MDESTFWWLATGALVALELAVGTFYLLMVAVGLAAAAIAAHLGLSPSMQFAAAAVVSVVAVGALHFYRKGLPANVRAGQGGAGDLDAGQLVTVEPHELGAEGVQVRYRGASWSVVMADASPVQAGVYAIERIDGARLVLKNPKHKH
jgi:membrane protein implicated in regulation of membrane protease activity